MTYQKLNTNHIMKSVIAMFFIICILISSCAVKYGIKNLLSLQPSAKSHTSAPKEKFTTNTTTASVCNFCKEREITAKNDTHFSVAEFQELAAFTFILFAGAFLFINLREHPFYSTSKIGITVPIFIQYRKLII
ncbi:hypothetical protein EG346_24955 [Chryseobacterium carnipullorum]|jgi:hypothetical protein|uniref:Lipoprotein n=10 Tax=Chryseobacterium group TaxID=2782232 RepID=A0A376EAY1_CHRCU|nr:MULTISPECIES: hypothetical protein [Chryseobacterium]AZA56745.1 hypothetical protein EG350_05970 [Chryseobacterium shandongense]AZB08371.1 hypothetical protein EG344_05625 [Chryseobacterium sp. G0162]KFC22400.1 hypothetical protein IO89_10740 [Epilithonimonas lactis]OCK52075.1 hypothetical protein BA768_14210 [Chryseobacterium sp. CBo1]REC68557.1 hypothetical protein DRF58_13905 [Epilithonimonas hispanica]CEJ69525.1 hypothetical protein BN1195_01827 [Chryseobacterium oranimense G311]SIO33